MTKQKTVKFTKEVKSILISEIAKLIPNVEEYSYENRKEMVISELRKYLKPEITKFWEDYPELIDSSSYFRAVKYLSSTFSTGWITIPCFRAKHTNNSTEVTEFIHTKFKSSSEMIENIRSAYLRISKEIGEVKSEKDLKLRYPEYYKIFLKIKPTLLPSESKQNFPTTIQDVQFLKNLGVDL